MDLKNNTLISYQLNTITNEFSSFNLFDYISDSHENISHIPIMHDLEKVKALYPKDEQIFMSMIKNNSFSILTLAKNKNFLVLSKKIMSLVSKDQDIDINLIESYYKELLQDKTDTILINLITDMQTELIKYSSFIASFNLTDNSFITSSLAKHREENELAKDVFFELIRLNKFDNIEDFELQIIKLGPDVQCFFFIFNNLAFVTYAIQIQVNAGIIRLKLRTWLKNNRSLFNKISIASENGDVTKDKSSSIQIEDIELDNQQKYIELELNFHNY